MADGVSDFADVDPEETAEWLEAVDGVIAADGPARAQDLLQRVITGAARRGVPMTAALPTRPRTRRPTRRSSGGSAPTCAGTRWRWCCGPTRSRRSSVATSPRISR